MAYYAIYVNERNNVPDCVDDDKIGNRTGGRIMFIGAHCIIYSTKPEEDREFIRDVLKFPNVDAGGGWLIFGLPPAEVAIHPSKKNNVHEFYLMCDDIDEEINHMKSLKIKCSKVQRQPWGLMTKLKLPGGGDLCIYQPLHVRPQPVRIRNSRKNIK